MKWVVYNKEGVERCEIRSLEYSGSFMGERFISLSIKSPEPILWGIGDYLDYRGERFTLNYIPTVVKKSSANSAGDAFAYDGVRLDSYIDELIRCEFLDYVFNDNLIHFSSLPTFGFHASTIQDLANRLQANLDRVYKGSNKWTIITNTENVAVSNVFVNVDKQKVWDGLALVFSIFKSNFTIRGRVITIGTAGAVLDNVFEYGKGKGLNQITKTSDSRQKIITRLRVYGSTRNLPYRYYNKLSNASQENFLPNNMAVKNLMLPSFPYETLDPFITSDNTEDLGIKEDSVFFDGSDQSLPEIYPSLEGMTAQQLISAGIPVYLDSGDNGKLDEIAFGAVNIDGSAISDDGIFEEGEAVPAFKITLKDIGFNIWDYRVDSQSPTISFKSGANGGRDFEILSCVREGNKYILTCNRVEDVDRFFPYHPLTINAGDRFVLINIEMPEVYIKAASQRLLSAGSEYLAKNDYVRYTYSVNISPIYMALNPVLHENIIEGDFLLFNDVDLDVSGSITIDKLLIKEGVDTIPRYEVTLTEEKHVGTLQRIQNQVNYLLSGGGSGNSSINTAQIEALIKLVGNSNFISKINPDEAQGLITFVGGLTSEEKAQFLKGIKVSGLTELSNLLAAAAEFSGTTVHKEGLQVGESFAPGFTGFGSFIDKEGKAWFEEVWIRTLLQVPEIRYNRINVYTGIRWDTFGAGLILDVEIDKDSNGNELNTGIITLKLEEGEYGAISEDDFCQGVFHDFDGENDVVNEDQRNGNFRFKGFNTVYFRIISILENDNSRFRYQLRPIGDNWSQTNHPRPFMNFAAYANPSNTDRQASVYTTTEYTIRLDNMTDWEYSEANIYGISGKLEGFRLGETVFQGHGHVMGNAYIYGHLQGIEDIIREQIQVGGKNLLREHALQFAGKYWGGDSEWKDIDIDRLLEFLTMENDRFVITENNLMIDLA